MEAWLKPLVFCLWLFLHCCVLRQVTKMGSRLEDLAILGMVAFGGVVALVCYAVVTYYIFLFVR